MMKKQQEEEKKEKENEERKNQNETVVLSSKSFSPILPALSLLKISTKIQYPQVDNGYCLEPTNFIFRPPKV